MNLHRVGASEAMAGPSSPPRPEAFDAQAASPGARPSAPPKGGAPSRLLRLPLYIVLNGGSGAHTADETSAVIEAALSAAGREHRVEIVRRGRDLPKAARRALTWVQDRNGAMVAAGGDGTLNAVAQVALQNDVRFAVMPQGTFNFFGREHGLSQETEHAVHDLLEVRETPVQVGEVNGHVFLVNASMGLYPQILEEREQDKRRLGRHRWVALWSALGVLLRRHRTLRLAVQAGGVQTDLDTPMLFVGNNGLQLRNLGVPEAGQIGRDRLVGMAMNPLTVGDRLKLMWKVARARLADVETLQRFALQSLTVRPRSGKPNRRFKIAVDGEILWMTAPIAFRVAPRPLRLLLPARLPAAYQAAEDA